MRDPVSDDSKVPTARPCSRPYGALPALCRRGTGHDGDCGPGTEAEQARAQFWEARERVKALAAKERSGEGWSPEWDDLRFRSPAWEAVHAAIRGYLGCWRNAPVEQYRHDEQCDRLTAAIERDRTATIEACARLVEEEKRIHGIGLNASYFAERIRALATRKG